MADPLMIRCPACGATNRVPPDKVARGLEPVCGRCKAPLPLAAAPSGGGAPIVVTDATFASDVEASPLPVLMDAWAPWCGPCRMIAPVIDELATEMAGRVRVVKLNVDDNPRTATRSTCAASRPCSCSGGVARSIVSWGCSPSTRSHGGSRRSWADS